MPGVVTEIIAKVAFEPRPNHPEDEGKNRLEVVVGKVFEEAEAGSLKAAEIIFDRLEGKVATNISPELALRSLLEAPEGTLTELFNKYKLGTGGKETKLLLESLFEDQDAELREVIEAEITK